MQDARLAPLARRLGKDRRQRFAVEVDIEEFHGIAPVFEPAAIQADAALVRFHTARALVREHPLGKQEIQPGAQIFAARREEMISRRIGVGQPFDTLSDRQRALKPRLLRRLVLAACNITQRPAGFINLGDLAAAGGRADMTAKLQV